MRPDGMKIQCYISVKEPSMDGMTITLPNNIVKMVAETAKKKSIPTMEVLRRMFTILKITQEEKAKGNALGIVNGDRVVVRFVGI